MKGLIVTIFILLMSGSVFAQNKSILITINNKTYEAELYDNNAVRSLISSLPQNISMSRWGGEYYGRLSKKIEYKNDKTQDVFNAGEIALWPSGNSLCIFFGPTPVSKKNEPRMASPGVAFGKIKGDISEFNKMGHNLNNVKITLKK